MPRGWPSFEQPPRAATEGGTSRDAVMRRRAGGRLTAGAPARQPVLHEALADAYLLYHVLEHDEQQWDEPKQHQLCRPIQANAQIRPCIDKWQVKLLLHAARAHESIYLEKKGGASWLTLIFTVWSTRANLLWAWAAPRTASPSGALVPALVKTWDKARTGSIITSFVTSR